jgi:hypothetical protein
MIRLQRSLNALGPWEGKVVAFVLGCGIGVLLRMVWVLSVIAYRPSRVVERRTRKQSTPWFSIKATWNQLKSSSSHPPPTPRRQV